MKKITVLIIDDHLLIRDAWKTLLETQTTFQVVATCGTAEEGINLAKSHSPAIILLDINLPGMNGLTATKLIRKFSPGTKIIGISLHTQIAYARLMMRSGASGYVTKNSSREEMIAAIKDVAEGKKYVCAEMRNIIAEGLTVDIGDGKKGLNFLSKRELEVIELLKKGFSSKEIAGSLHLSVKTVEVHRYNILKKLDLRNTAAVINFINHTYLENGQTIFPEMNRM